MAATAAPVRPTRHARAQPRSARGDIMAASRAPTYVEIAPPPVLVAFVECLWVHRIDGPPPPEGRRLLPDGRGNMVWIADVGVRVARPAQRFLRPPPMDRMLAFRVRFHPGAARSLLRTDACELVDMHVVLDQVDPGLARRIDDRLSGAPDPHAAVAALADELALRLAGAEPPDPAVRAAVALLDRSDATVAA